MFFTLEKPDLSKVNKEETFKIFTGDNRVNVYDFVKKTMVPEYLYWDKVRYKEPVPEGITKESLWVTIKTVRAMQSSPTVIRDKNDIFFKWSKLDYFEEFFHELDMNTGGEIFTAKGGLDKANKQKLVTRGIMEEAIASSQLEGAATSRQTAKKMIREGRRPVNKSEQMIINSYLSMNAIENEYKNKEMSLDLLLELHSLITKDTLDDQNEKPRMRKPGEHVNVSDKATGIIYYQAPDIKFVKEELVKLVNFANGNLGNNHFIHPLIKAIMLHFWIGYLHPFTDGNGRLARLIFYWYLAKQGYWAFVYLPISKIIKKSPKQYSMAYVYSEQDENDLTYFLDYNIRKIKLAVREFEEYLTKQTGHNLQMKKKCELKYKLNIRQIQLLQYLHGDSEERTTVKAHMNVNQVVKMTARKDLKDLVDKRFLTANRMGHTIYYYGTEKIKELF